MKKISHCIVINFSAHPNENRTQFSKEGLLEFSLPTTNILASAKHKSNMILQIQKILLQV